MLGHRYLINKMLANDKRRKNPNMTYKERCVLVELVQEHYSIVGSKKTDGPSQQAKNVEWQKIADLFNARGLGTERDSANLRGTWENLKKSARKAAAAETDDEVRKRLKQDPIVEKVQAVLQTSVEGVTNTYDVDSQCASAGEELCVLANGSVDGTPVELSFEGTNWSEYSNNAQKTPPYQSLSSSAGNQDDDNFDTVGTSANVKPEIEVIHCTASLSDEPASTSDEPIVDQTASVRAKQNKSMTRSALQDDSEEKLNALKAEAAARAMEEEGREQSRREELHKIHLTQEKLKVEILKEQLKQERLKTARLLSDLGE